MFTLNIVNGENISGLIHRTLDHVDSRLMNHGIRVAYIASKMLKAQGKYNKKEIQDICFLAMLHDVGAYKTEEIDQMVQFESENMWQHSIYGYLFLYHLTPLKEWADAVLFHHVRADHMQNYKIKCPDVAQLINLADRVDVICQGTPPDLESLRSYLRQQCGKKFTSEVIDLFWQAEEASSFLSRLDSGISFEEIVPDVALDQSQILAYLNMLIYAIDFRSCYTVTHTITTTRISYSAAKIMGLNEEQLVHVYFGAMLHDLGKIGIPVEILEYPGSLSPQAMNIMRSHVNITEEILAGTIDPVTTNIALHHHEKLNGAGYPRGLKEEELTLEERIVAVGDIVSALIGRRSYKDSFSVEKTLDILQNQADHGLLDHEVIQAVKENFNEILEEVRIHCTPILKVYQGINDEYKQLLKLYSDT